MTCLARVAPIPVRSYFKLLAKPNYEKNLVLLMRSNRYGYPFPYIYTRMQYIKA